MGIVLGGCEMSLHGPSQEFFSLRKVKKAALCVICKSTGDPLKLIGKITLIREKYCEVSVKFNFAL